MLAQVGAKVSGFFRATAPDPFVLAVLLTALTFAICLVFGQDAADASLGVGDVVAMWSDPANGVWKFLGFGMQMCLILVTGHALASSPPVAAALCALARLPRSGAQAAALVAFTAGLLGTLNWGLGLIGGALIARDVGREMARRGIPVHYPLIAAAGYVGLLVWHGGFSGTAPLKVTTASEIQDVLPEGLTFEPIPLDQTLLSGMNLIVTGGLLLLAPLIMALMAPHRESCAPIGRFVEAEPRPDEDLPRDSKAMLPRLLEDTPIVSLILVALIGWWAWGYYLPGGGDPSGARSLTPNTVNLTMLMLGLLLHGTPARYVRAVEEAARGCAGIILQFPLYAGIMGMMHGAGLTRTLAEGISGVASETTLPLLTFCSAAVVNLFVPSGGGQWGVQGPIAIESALETGVPLPKIVMSVAYGDQLTNMLQPFWALPLLAITGVKARDIVGYTAVLMVVAAVWVGFWLLVL